MFKHLIEKPAIVLDEDRAKNNIRIMADKVRKTGARFRPHFKTHQNIKIGQWFKDAGVNEITVSSLGMAEYFSGSWNDITIAFPVNIREIIKINKLGKKIKLNLLVESEFVIRFLENNLQFSSEIWIKVDTGYKRTGVIWDDFQSLKKLVKQIENSKNMLFKGILTHAGHSYKAKSKEEIKVIYFDSFEKLKKIRDFLISECNCRAEISFGDTPCCSVIDDFEGMDEIRPGNFVFYDISQMEIGSCTENEIAAVIACPVVAKSEKRGEIVIYGGAVHLSKDFILNDKDEKIFGYVTNFKENGWGGINKSNFVSSVSQEHGIVKISKDNFDKYQIGDIIAVLPVHSCLAVNLLMDFVTLKGEFIKKFDTIL
ncbi:alanine racemase [candidate division KSB1 bacterium]